MTERSRRPAGPCQDVSVLVVEDHDDSPELLVFALAQAGAVVTGVSSANEALERLETLRPDVLVSDLSMPGRDGFSLIQAVRSCPGLETLPAITVTGHSHPEVLTRVMRTGFQRCMRKPINIADLCEAIRTLASARERPPVP